VDTRWQNPLPLGEYATIPAVVCVHSDLWIPITCLSYSEAIALYHKALPKGKEILVFPPGLELETKNIFLTESPRWLDELVSEIA
jgi:hypothetical protein